MLQFHFKLANTLKFNAGSGFSKILINFPTKNEDDISQFEDGLGRFTQNNEEIDCVSDFYPNKNDHFNCKIIIGT